jgi:hypothetical protein
MRLVYRVAGGLTFNTATSQKSAFVAMGSGSAPLAKALFISPAAQRHSASVAAAG